MMILNNLAFTLIVWFFINSGLWIIEEYLTMEHKIYLYDIVIWFSMLCLWVWLNFKTKV